MQCKVSSQPAIPKLQQAPSPQGAAELAGDGAGGVCAAPSVVGCTSVLRGGQAWESWGPAAAFGEVREGPLCSLDCVHRS